MDFDEAIERWTRHDKARTASELARIIAGVNVEGLQDLMALDPEKARETMGAWKIQEYRRHRKNQLEEQLREVTKELEGLP